MFKDQLSSHHNNFMELCAIYRSILRRLAPTLNKELGEPNADRNQLPQLANIAVTQSEAATKFRLPPHTAGISSLLQLTHSILLDIEFVVFVVHLSLTVSVYYIIPCSSYPITIMQRVSIEPASAPPPKKQGRKPKYDNPADQEAARTESQRKHNEKRKAQMVAKRATHGGWTAKNALDQYTTGLDPLIATTSASAPNINQNSIADQCPPPIPPVQPISILAYQAPRGRG